MFSVKERCLRPINVLFNVNGKLYKTFPAQCLLACRSRQASIVLERYFRFEVSLLSTLCMRIEMGASRVSGDSDIIT